MCSDDNKGDLSIIENTIKILKDIYPESQIIIQNADYSEREIKNYKLNRFSQKLADSYYGSFFPKVFSTRGESKIKSVSKLIFNSLVSLWIIVNTWLFKKLGRGFLFHIPRKHKDTWRDLVDCDFMVVKGGSYIYSFGGIKQLLFVYRMLYSTILSIILRKRVILLGHSIGPSRGVLMTSLIKQTLKKVDKIMLREQISHDYVLEKLGLHEDKIELIPDLAFFNSILQKFDRERTIEDIIKKENISSISDRDTLIGITVRDWWFPGKKNPQRLLNNYIQVLIGTINYLREEYNSKILFIPHCLEDLEFAELLYSRLDNRKNIHVLRGDYTTTELKNLLSILKILIGTRIHSTIFALSVGTPVIAIAYEIHKGFGILAMAGQKDFVLDISRLKNHDLLSNIDLIMSQHNNLQASIKKRVSAIKSELENKVSSYFTQILN